MNPTYEREMSKYSRRIATVIKNPNIGIKYISWLFQKHVAGQEPVRNIYGFTLGGFNGFSEYLTVSDAMSEDAETFIRSFRPSRGAILDIGANLGVFSLALSQRNKAHQFYAIEPGPTTFSSLEKNIKRNNRKNIIYSRCAITDHDGEARFIVRENARANASIAREGSKDVNTVAVPCYTLDSYCRQFEIERIAMLKVDVEGFEALVFRGAGRVLKHMRPPVIYFEVCPALARLAGFDPLEVPSTLTDFGYELKRFTQYGRLETITSSQVSDVERVENWLAVLPS